MYVTMLILSVGLFLLVGAASAQTTLPSEPPEGAIILFDGDDVDHWIHRDGQPARWRLVDGAMEVNGGDIISREGFRDFTAHVEFRCSNEPPHVTGQGRGNSGVYLQDRYEIQVLDSWGVPEHTMRDCGAIYNKKAPDVNASTPPETWQTYDIVFKAARFNEKGEKTANARATIWQNGQKIHDDVEISDVTGGSVGPESPEPAPFRLQDHGNKVRYRNIWVVPAKE